MNKPNITVNEFKSALSQKSTLRKGDVEILNFLYNQPDHKASVVEIAEILGKDHFVEINGAFGRLGKRIAEFLNKDELFDFDGWNIIASGEKESNYFVWQLRHNFVRALEEMNILSTRIYEHSGNETEFYEGLRRRVTFDIYERSKEARDKCIEFYKATCQICGFNGEEKYGPVGVGIIHAHHFTSFKQNKQVRKTNPEMDLIALCPNCHFLVHKRDPSYTIEEIKKLIKK